MGTTPTNFPPESALQIGQIITGNALSLTASLAATVFFTAPTTGLYLVAMALRIVATNNAGTLAATMTTPHAGNVAQALTGSAGAAVTAIEKDLSTTATATDGYAAAIPLWMNAGDQIEVATTATGLTGTTYDVFVSAQRLF